MEDSKKFGAVTDALHGFKPVPEGDQMEVTSISDGTVHGQYHFSDGTSRYWGCAYDVNRLPEPIKKLVKSFEESKK